MLRSALPLALLGSVLLASCAHHTTAPATPTATPPSDARPLVFAAPDVITRPFASFTLALDGEQATILPLREGVATPGQLFHVDLTDALTRSFCTDCLNVTQFTRLPEGVRVELSLRHPFELANDALPPNAKNRRDLWLSNVRGVLISAGTGNYFGSGIHVDPTLLLNPDGYTPLVTPGTGDDNTVYPYRVFGAEGANLTNGNFSQTLGWSGHPNDPTGYLVLANDQVATASYDIALQPGESRQLELDLTGAFSPGATGVATRLTPNYFMPAGTSPDAWRVTARMDGELDAFNDQSAVNLHLEVLDWQLDPAVQVDAAFPVTGDRQRIPVASGIKAIELSWPAIIGPTTQQLDLTGADGRGLASDPWQLNVEVSNTAAAGPGHYTGLVRVIDERDPRSIAAPFGNTTFIGPDLMTPYGAPSQFATYAVVAVDVIGSTECLEVFEVFTGEADLYIPGEPLYAYVQTQGELDTLLSELQSEPTEVLFDPQFDSVVVAVGGWFFTGRDQRAIRISDACPVGSSLHIGITRTENVSGCLLGGLPTAPMTIAVVPTRNPTVVFGETLEDYCATVCNDQTWMEVASGDAVAEGGYAGKLLDQYCPDELAYNEALATLGLTAAPPVDFGVSSAWVLSAPSASDPKGARFSEVLAVCKVPSSDHYRLTWQHGEYATCDPPSGIATAPYIILTLPRNTGGGTSAEYRVDLCEPAFKCLPLNAPEAAFGDYPANTASEPQAVYISDAFQYESLFNSFFTDIPTRPFQPLIDFEQWDALLLSGGFTNTGAGQRSLHAFTVCLDKTTDILHITEQREEPLTCVSSDAASHPWTLILVPDGGPWTLDRQVTTLDTCRTMGDCERPTLVAEGIISDYFDPAAQYHYFGQVNFPERVEAYQAAWAQLSQDPAPGLADLQPNEAILLFVYGFRLDDLGGYQTRLEQICRDQLRGDLIAEVTRLSAPNDCVIPNIRNSAWRIYKFPWSQTTCNIAIELAEECPTD